MMARMRIIFALVLAVRVWGEVPTHFSFSDPTPAGATRVAPTLKYSAEMGYGFDVPPSGDEGFIFSVDVAEGNYDVTVVLGDAKSDSDTTVKAEQRRLMAEAVKTAAGRFETRTFTVNVRTAALAGGGAVKLKGREGDMPRWDKRLSLEFVGPRPRIASVKIERNDKAVTVFLAGDSTVTDSPREPYNSWGQMLTRFFKAGVAVANHAESGESLRSFTGSKRIDKIYESIKPGDWLFIQFGHNDQKDKRPEAGAMTTYKTSLLEYAKEATKRGAKVVIVTPVSRRSFGAEGKIVSNLGEFPEAARLAAKEAGVALIDLNAMSQRFYEAMGVEASKQAFAPGDNTHHNNYGSYEIAKCVVKGIVESKLELARFVVEDFSFEPSRPDEIGRFAVPASVGKTNVKPEGN